MTGDAPSLAAPAQPGPSLWRALAEEGVLLAIGGLGYAVTRPPANGAHAEPFTAKLTFGAGAWGFDADSLGLNYLGHPVAGLCYYQVARGNRLNVGASLGLTLASSFAWEMLEFQEQVSVHDVVATTVGGVALGEPLTQLASWFAQREGVAARVMEVLFQLPRAFHDLLDDAPPASPIRWGPADLAIWTTAGASWPRPSGQAGELRFGARSRLIRAGEVGMPGSGWRTLLDANVTSLSAELALGPHGVVEANVLALASLAGFYGRGFKGVRHGHDLLATVSLGYDYLQRAKSINGSWANDFLALVRTPGLELVASLRRGALRAELGFEVAVTLGGVRPFALLGQPTDLPGAPGVLRMSGYYHGLGGMLAPRVSFSVGGLDLVASYRFDRLRAIESADVAPPPDGGHLALEDERRDLKISLTWRLPITWLSLFAIWERRDRWGRAGESTTSADDSTALFGPAARY